MLKITQWGLSDIGLVRKNNEDAWSCLENHHFFALADGMGGHQAGEIAAKEAVEFVCSSVEELLSSSKKWEISELKLFTKLFIENANSWVHYLGRKRSEYQGMGTTLSTLLFYENFLIYGHVGDSRIYQLRDHTLKQLTTDHTLHNQTLLDKKSFYSSSLSHKNILTKALGPRVEIFPEIAIAPIEINDIYLLCSDGLSDQLPDLEIAGILKQDSNPKTAAFTLLNKAKERGGSDNITAIVVKIDAVEKKDFFR
ncbi:MAG: serine/threonine-protein phosphatase [Simkania negevensis]|nr:serine/threonine-protein phosphatase [Simkania negevensis]